MEFQEHKRLLELLPGFLRQYREYRVIMGTEQVELDSIQARISDLLSDGFIDTATEEGLAHMERMYGIAAEKGASLNERRFAIKTKLSRSLPYTMRQYRAMLAAMCGAGNFEVALDHGEYALRVIVPVERNGWELAKAVNQLSKEVLPANLSYFYILRHDVLTPIKTAHQMGLVFTTSVIARGKPRTLDGSWPLDGTCLLDGTWRFGVYGARHDCHVGVRQEAAYGAMIEARKDLWRLDGTVKLDGSRRLDAEIHGLEL